MSLRFLFFKKINSGSFNFFLVNRSKLLLSGDIFEFMVDLFLFYDFDIEKMKLDRKKFRVK